LPSSRREKKAKKKKKGKGKGSPPWRITAPHEKSPDLVRTPSKKRKKGAVPVERRSSFGKTRGKEGGKPCQDLPLPSRIQETRGKKGSARPSASIARGFREKKKGEKKEEKKKTPPPRRSIAIDHVVVEEAPVAPASFRHPLLRKAQGDFEFCFRWGGKRKEKNPPNNVSAANL